MFTSTIQIGRRSGNPQRLGQIACLISIILCGAVLMVSCGNGDEDTELALETPLPQAVTEKTQAKIQPNLPCHVSLAPKKDVVPLASPTPQVIRIQLLEHPYRVVPNDIVLEQNSLYRFIVQAGNEWHGFRVPAVGLGFEIPPGGQGDKLVRPSEPGVFPIVNWRRMPESEVISTITVVPEGASVSTWHSLCGQLQIHSPLPGAAFSTPFVIEGSAIRASGTNLHITRVEALSDNVQVGVVTSDQMITHYSPSSDFLARATKRDFYLSISNLHPGEHTLLFKAYSQNGSLVAAASMPITVVPSTPDNTLPQGYRGYIDNPSEDELIRLPVIIQGWAVIPNSKEGTGIGAVELWNGPRETGQFLATATYGTYRPDVAEILGNHRYASSGFFAQLSDLPAGQVDLHVYIRDRESGAYVSPQLSESPLSRRIYLAEGKVADAAWPVALAPAPDGRLFFAELQTGNIRILQDGEVLPRPFATLDDVTYHREAGLLGLALHPDFPRQPYVYAMYVVDDAETGLPRMQRVVRFRDVNNTGQDYTVILEDLPYAPEGFHNGGRIAFGPDGKLYLSIGDIGMIEVSQDPTKLAGSILRFNLDGSIPEDNPIPGFPVYAIGFRNVFGLAFQPDTGFLFATENGPGGLDEVNKVEAGQNYGWPLHLGVTNQEGFADPVAVYGQWPEISIGPTGATFTAVQPDLLLLCGFADFYLRGVRLKGPDYTSTEFKMILSANCALDVAYSSDGWLYYSTPSAIYRARLDDLLRLHEQKNQ